MKNIFPTKLKALEWNLQQLYGARARELEKIIWRRLLQHSTKKAKVLQIEEVLMDDPMIEKESIEVMVKMRDEVTNNKGDKDLNMQKDTSQAGEKSP